MTLQDVVDPFARRRSTGFAGETIEASTYESIMCELLADDAHTRKHALLEALSRHWIDRGRGALIRAVVVEPGSSRLERLAFGRFVGSLKTADHRFVKERDGILYFIGRPAISGSAADTVPEAIVSAAGHRAVVIRAQGTAHWDRRGDDLSIVAENARRAAEIAGRLPDFGASADISELGAWTLLDSLAAEGGQVGLFSPAAIRLWNDKNRLQLETVEAYLDTCGRVRDACERLHIHRTTLYYRLDNLPIEVKEALDDGLSRSALHLCLKLLRYGEAPGLT
ncbi:helix-turn-helix domain-containing protein [Herbiconiux sp. 11R-BC]|uniref:helix-turn-helix domain-containing protein n=1 Tax=Herbiconiux sp. 11R-BC TaxID=3111637 RepID=UPI003BFA8BAC